MSNTTFMNKSTPIILINLLLTACTASTTADTTSANAWDELRCAEESGLLIEGEPLKCRISKEENGEIIVLEHIIGETEPEVKQEFSPKLSKFLQNSNISFENIWVIENPVIGNEGAVVLKDNEYVQLYMFTSEEEARIIHQILGDKTNLPNNVQIDWGENAVFFHLGEIIAVYQGENEDLFMKDK
ncbi:MAG: hypothetical protein KAS32_01425 [Candidatus Peribacteraceae bacterium]|nr:hypothetical protein [Candidatus Peribacteraceae bacterium]